MKLILKTASIHINITKYIASMVLLLCISYHQTFSQTKLQTFSEDDVIILEELVQLLETWDKKDARRFMDEFSEAWANKINMEQKKLFVLHVIPC